jgi:hypothetical protein
MSLDRRLREGLDRSSSAIEERLFDRVLEGVVARGRRRRRVRRIAAGTLALAALIGAVVIAPKALDAIRSIGETRPASPQDLMRQIAGTYTIEVDRSGGAVEGPHLRTFVRGIRRRVTCSPSRPTGSGRTRSAAYAWAVSAHTPGSFTTIG